MVDTNETPTTCAKTDSKPQTRHVLYYIERKCQCLDCPAAQRENEFVARVTKGIHELAERMKLVVRA